MPMKQKLALPKNPGSISARSGANVLLNDLRTLILATRGTVAHNINSALVILYWQIGSSATLGTSTRFYGSILADQSITLATGAGMVGRALALNGAVTLDNNDITIPTHPAAVPERDGLWPTAFLASVFGAGQWLANSRRKRVCRS